MFPKQQHIPGEPDTPEPPEELIQLYEKIEHPYVHRKGISCTHDGKWALYVTVPKNIYVPIDDLELQCEGFPIVYEAEPEEPLQPL